MNHWNFWWLPVFSLVILSAACSPTRLASPVETPPPAPAMNIQDIATPTIPPLELQRQPTVVGFNIRGWT
jgi:hypothetical protein